MSFLKNFILFLFCHLFIASFTYGQGLLVKGKAFYLPFGDKKNQWYGLALEKELGNLWSIEAATSWYFDSRRENKGKLYEATFSTLEIKKSLGFTANDATSFFFSAFGGFGKLEKYSGSQSFNSLTIQAKGLTAGIGAGMKVFFSKSFGGELSFGPRYFFAKNNTDRELRNLKFGRFSVRVGFNFFWRFGKVLDK